MAMKWGWEDFVVGTSRDGNNNEHFIHHGICMLKSVKILLTAACSRLQKAAAQSDMTSPGMGVVSVPLTFRQDHKK